jgi:hypothetical protein
MLTRALALDVEVFKARKWPAYSRGPAYAVAVQGDYAYVAAGPTAFMMRERGALIIIDIRDPANPQRVGGYATSGRAQGVAVAGNYAYVADGAASLEVIDLVNLAKDRFHFMVTGESGQKARVQRSRNLRDWEDWLEVTLGTGPADLTDTNILSAPCGFYRAVAP